MNTDAIILSHSHFAVMYDRYAVRVHVSLRGLHRAVGAVVLVLFSYQATALARAGCHLAGGAPMPLAMAGMAHQRDGLVTTNAPTLPAPPHGSQCDHSLPASACSVGVGCMVAVPRIPVAVTEQPAVHAEAFGPPTNGPLSLEFAPEPPPPRS